MVDTHKLKNILVTGVSSRFFKFLKYELKNYQFSCPKKNQFDLLNLIFNLFYIFYSYCRLIKTNESS